MTRAMLLLLLALPLAAAEPVNLMFEDQFNAKSETKNARGQVLVLVYGDRKASDECRKLGEQLHEALGDKVKVQAVACCGKMPALMRPLLRTQIAKAAPTTPVWLDFTETMVTSFGITTGQANVAVFDKEGRYRHLLNGTPEEKQLKELMRVVQTLQIEK